MANITGSIYSDFLLLGSQKADVVYGLSGSDWINALGGDDVIHGDYGMPSIQKLSINTPGGIGGLPLGVGQYTFNDIINAGSGNDTVFGEIGNDTVTADQGNDYVFGGEGNDSLNGDAGNDVIYGDDDNIIIILPDDSGREASANVVVEETIGSGYNDTVNGGAGDDELHGVYGNDIVSGDAGADTVEGGYGNDTLLGGAGNDRFQFDGCGSSYNIGHDTIVDFGLGKDKIEFIGNQFDWATIQADWHVQGLNVVLYDNAQPWAWSVTIVGGVTSLTHGANDFIFTPCEVEEY